jgi:hypothetical protein
MIIIKLFLIVLVSLILISGCSEENDVIDPIDLLSDDYDNIPVKVNTEDSFTFTLSANDFDYFTEDDINFTNDSLVVTITSTNAEAANSSFTLYGSNDNILFSEGLNDSKVTVKTDLTGEIPERVKIELNDYSGQLTIVVALLEN